MSVRVILTNTMTGLKYELNSEKDTVAEMKEHIEGILSQNMGSPGFMRTNESPINYIPHDIVRTSYISIIDTTEEKKSE